MRKSSFFRRSAPPALSVLAALTACAPPAPREPPTQLCAGVATGDGASVIVAHQDDIARVEPQLAEVSQKQQPRLVGVTVYIVARPGETAQWWARELACNAAHLLPCPVEACDASLGSVTSDVQSTGPTFRIDLTARDAPEARELLRRARALRGTVD